MADIAALLTAALGRAITSEDRIAVAVSGGIDSAALLLLTAAAFPGRVTALTVDHGLRAGSASEADGVGKQCAVRGIPHHSLAWQGPKPVANLQAAARAARYALLAGWCTANATAILLTAHHADDQAETLLMRLARGSGGPGLAGIRRRRLLANGVTLVRPLLATRRAALGAIVDAAGWVPADDPSNRNLRFARTHARRLLADADWIDVPNVARAAAHLGDVDAALEWVVDRAWAGRAVVSGATITIDGGGLPSELARRLVRRALAILAPENELRGGDVMRFIDRLQAGRTTTLAGVQARGGTIWHFGLAARRRKQHPK